MEKFQKGALTQTQAQQRAPLFSSTDDAIHYDLFLKLMKGEIFEGNLTATFDLLKDNTEGLFFDYSGAYIHQITINGNKLSSANDNYESLRDKRFLRIPATHLKQGRNQINIIYSNIYANDGLGLHSFYDTDGKQYLYSQGEIYDINKVFPCFDQPDLKATLSLTMAVPNEWIAAVANQPELPQPSLNIDKYLSQEDQKLYKVTSYSATPRLSSYLFAFIAGPYREIKCQNLHRDIPMSVYSRESLFPLLQEQAEEIFEVTRETLSFYERFFNTPYPFAKYDTIFSAEFFFFAMENAGAVVFDDKYIWREKVSLDKSIMRNVLIAHEAAHHWFGDLVTMKWWNDIWLNESFAEFISYFCLHNIKSKVTKSNLEYSWVKFFEETDWGYSDDQKRTTHPIAGEVRDTTEALGVFDGITYSKGAASLKQIMHLIGEEKFGLAMYHYFKKFAWKNTTLDDFITNLQEFYKPTDPRSPANLEEWKNEWLMTAGVNECLPLFNPEDHSSEAKLVIRQTAALKEFPTLRHHKMKIAFFDEEARVYEEKDLVLNNAPETVITYDGSKKPRAVLLNYKNESFIKVRLDQHSISFLRKKAAAISDDLTKAIFWKSLFDMVRDGQIPASSFIEAATQVIESEKSDWILSSILTFAKSVLKYSPKILKKNILKPKLFDRLLKALISTGKNFEDERTIILRENLIKFASYGQEKGVDNLQILKEWFDGTHQDLCKFELDAQNKWDIVIALHKHPKLDNHQKANLFSRAAESDSSDRMKLMEKRCEAMRQQGNEREKLEQSFLDASNKDSAYLIEQTMKGFSTSIWSVQQDEEKFFSMVEKIFELKSDEAGKKFYKALFPRRENFSYYVKRIENLLKEGVQNELLQKILVNSLDDLEKRKKGYVCCGADLMKNFLDISL